MASEGGAGGIRTLVQTSNYNAFYMLSFHLGFREIAGRKLPTHSLSSFELHDAIKALASLGLLLRSHYINRRKPRPLSDFLLSRSYRDEAYRTIIRVMQLGRSYSRRLKSVKYDIYELYPSARHAYNTIRPAVKTSRPLLKLRVMSAEL